jgi:hypothetical protein
MARVGGLLSGGWLLIHKEDCRAWMCSWCLVMVFAHCYVCVTLIPWHQSAPSLFCHSDPLSNGLGDKACLGAIFQHLWPASLTGRRVKWWFISKWGIFKDQSWQHNPWPGQRCGQANVHMKSTGSFVKLFCKWLFMHRPVRHLNQSSVTNRSKRTLESSPVHILCKTWHFSKVRVTISSNL